VKHVTEQLNSRYSVHDTVKEPFTVLVRFDDPRYVVMMTGDLDVASRASAVRACTASDHVDVVVNLTDVAFMDSAGYRALVEARAILEHRGGSLVSTGAVGEPQRLLSLLEPTPWIGRC
jgi:anti-anti-sigma factor